MYKSLPNTNLIALAQSERKRRECAALTQAPPSCSSRFIFYCCWSSFCVYMVIIRYIALLVIEARMVIVLGREDGERERGWRRIDFLLLERTLCVHLRNFFSLQPPQRIKTRSLLNSILNRSILLPHTPHCCCAGMQSANAARRSSSSSTSIAPILVSILFFLLFLLMLDGCLDQTVLLQCHHRDNPDGMGERDGCRGERRGLINYTDQECVYVYRANDDCFILKRIAQRLVQQRRQ